MPSYCVKCLTNGHTDILCNYLSILSVHNFYQILSCGPNWVFFRFDSLIDNFLNVFLQSNIFEIVCNCICLKIADKEKHMKYLKQFGFDYIFEMLKTIQLLDGKLNVGVKENVLKIQEFIDFYLFLAHRS